HLVDARAELAREATRLPRPFGDGFDDLRKLLGSQNDQGDRGDQQHLRPTEVEHVRRPDALASAVDAGAHPITCGGPPLRSFSRPSAPATAIAAWPAPRQAVARPDPRYPSSLS